jgi:hypothetical protein
MKQTIAGIIYDSDSDQLVAGEMRDEKDWSLLNLQRTAVGHFYIERIIPQMWKDGTWQNRHDTDDLVNAGITSFPDPRLRNLRTIRPLSQSEALLWWVENFAPDEFKAVTQQALGQWLAHEEGGQRAKASNG